MTKVVFYRHCGDFEPVVAISLSDKNVVIFDKKNAAHTDQNKVCLQKFEGPNTAIRKYFLLEYNPILNNFTMGSSL